MPASDIEEATDEADDEGAEERLRGDGEARGANKLSVDEIGPINAALFTYGLACGAVTAQDCHKATHEPSSHSESGVIEIRLDLNPISV